MIQPKTPKKIKGARKKAKGARKGERKKRRYWDIQTWGHAIHKARGA